MAWSYEFKERDAYDFSSSQHIATRVRGEELHFSRCPYCNGGTKKDKETFSISLKTGQYKCLRASCGAQGNFVTLARDFDFSLGRDYEAYYSNKNKFRKFSSKKVESHDAAVEYMKSRGISENTTRKYEITVHKDNPSVLVFPFYDENNNLRFIKYRKTNFQQGVDKNKEWCETNCMPILFGMKQCNERFDRLIITEGQIDSLSVAEAGIENVVSVPTGAKGFTWVPYVWDWFNKFDEIIVFGDCEKGQITLLEDLKKRFPKTIKVVKVEDYRGCKDANELLQNHGKEAVIQAIEKAEIVPVKNVKSLADVKAVDIYKLPKISTKIKEIDKIIKGLYKGQVILITGKRGEGKSTFVGQITTNALEQEKKVLSYSGELPDYFFKRWLDFQIAGPRNIVTNETKEGGCYYSITNSTIDRINDWYRDRMFIYDNNITEDDELEDLIKTIEIAIMQYGIDMVCIDNLMTALDVGMSEDLYRSQSKFVNRLCRLAKRLDVTVILVAHPKKNSISSDVNEEVSGSADITNRVDVVMKYYRAKDDDDDTRHLIISKNRLTGDVTKGDGIRLMYDKKSKRIIDAVGDFNYRYKWEENEEGFFEITESENPFV